MSEEVERYSLEEEMVPDFSGRPRYEWVLSPNKYGGWVTHTDYKKLQKTNELLTSIVEQHQIAREQLLEAHEKLLAKYNGVFEWYAERPIGKTYVLAHPRRIAEATKKDYEESLK